MTIFNQVSNQLSNTSTLHRPGKYNLALILFSVALFGYPIVGNLVSIINVDSRVLTIPFRILLVFVSLLLILTSRSFKFNYWHILLFCFWTVYLLRLIHDSIYTDLPDAFYAMQFFISSSVIPVIALMKSRDYHEYYYAKTSLYIAITGCTVSFTLWLLEIPNNQLETFTGRLSEEALNPITIGNLGVSAILCGLVMLQNTHAGLFSKLFIVMSFIISSACIALAASKGPMLALILCLILWGLSQRAIYKTVLFCCILLSAYLVILADNGLSMRVVNFLSDPLSQESTQLRLTLFRDTLSQINISPITGSAFVELNSQQYPHNLFIESALAVGIPLSCLFVALIVKGTVEAWKSLNNGRALLGLLFFQSLIVAMVSGALFGATMLWLTLALLLYKQKF